MSTMKMRQTLPAYPVAIWIALALLLGGAGLATTHATAAELSESTSAILLMDRADAIEYIKSGGQVR